MPRLRVIVLDTPDPQRADFRVAFWYDVPVSRQPFYKPQRPSIWINATDADNANFAAGAYTEVVQIYAPDVNKTLGQMTNDLAAIWTAGQAAVTALNRWTFYGSNWDGTTWTEVQIT